MNKITNALKENKGKIEYAEKQIETKRWNEYEWMNEWMYVILFLNSY